MNSRGFDVRVDEEGAEHVQEENALKWLKIYNQAEDKLESTTNLGEANDEDKFG